MYPEGPLTKWSPLICFPSIRKRRQNSQLFSKYLCTVGLVCSASSQTVVKHSESHRICSSLTFFGKSSPNRSVFEGQSVNFCQASPLPAPFTFFSFFSFLSSAQQFTSCKITHSTGLLIGSGEASSRFKWKCKVCLESKVMRSDELGPHGNASHLMPL